MSQPSMSQRPFLPGRTLTAWVLGLALFFLAAGVAAHARRAGEAPGPRPVVGFEAPPFVLADLAGRPVSLSSLRGTPVLVNFWATWCGPCRVEMPALEKMQRKYGGRLRVLAVNMTGSEASAAAVGRFVERAGYTFPVLLDEDGAVADAYMVGMLPTSFFMDGDGIIRSIRSGMMTARMMEAGIRQVLEGPAAGASGGGGGVTGP